MFVLFLREPAAIAILFDGFIWLENAANKAGDGFFKERNNLQTHLANLLEVTLQKHKSELMTNKRAYASFLSAN